LNTIKALEGGCILKAVRASREFGVILKTVAEDEFV
jgi:hypothetical protein